MPGTSTPAHGPTSLARRAAPASSVPDPQLRSATAPRASSSLSVAVYHQEYRRRHGQRSMSRQQEESKAQSSSEPRAPPRGNDVLFSELEEGEVDYDEPMGSEDHSNPTSPRSHTGAASSPASSVRSSRSTVRSPTRRDLRTPHPFSERSNPIRALRDAPPLSSRYGEEDRYDHNVITNDLDEAQGRQLSNEQRSQSFRPLVRPLVLTSRRDYGFQPRNPAEAARLAAQQPLNTYTCGPAASTTDEQVQRHRLRERYLTPQVTTPQEYQARLQMQLSRQPVPSMRTIPVVLNPGESQRAYEAQFRSWVEGARRLPSYNALRASFAETDIRLERRLR
ncbi:hypothetical protein PInf_003347 [Phytophthora infestans]|nr:hypothetical protein PInf_003347 [Phytophthora infestans]